MIFSSTFKEFSTDISGNAVTSGKLVFSQSGKGNIYGTTVRNLILIFPFFQTTAIRGNVTIAAEEGVQATTKRSIAIMNIALRLGDCMWLSKK